MDEANTSPARPVIAAVVASALLFFLGTGLRPVPALAWFAAAPVLALACALPRGRDAFGLAALAFALGASNMAAYLAGIVPIPVVALALLQPALAFGGCVLLARLAARRRPGAVAVFTLPLAWAAYEWLASWIPAQGSFGSLAYSQMDFLPAIQVASLAGHTSISFLLMLSAAGLALAWDRRRNGKRALAAALPAAIVVIAALSWGVARLHERNAGPVVRVGLAATDRTIRDFRTTSRDTALAVVREYMGRVDRLAARGAKIVVLPEKFVGVSDATTDSVLSLLKETSGRDRVLLVAGINRLFPRAKHNWAVITRDGEDRGRYDKAHMVPNFEAGYYRAEEIRVLSDGDLPRLGVAICKDMDFPAWTLRYAREAVDVMLVPAWDFGVDGWLHSRMAVLRGVECGFSVARSAQDGRLTLSDPYGRVLAEASSADGDEVLLAGAVPSRGVPTPYRSSNVPAWLVGLAALMLAWPGSSATRTPREGGRGAA